MARRLSRFAHDKSKSLFIIADGAALHRFALMFRMKHLYHNLQHMCGRRTSGMVFLGGYRVLSEVFLETFGEVGRG